MAGKQKSPKSEESQQILPANLDAEKYLLGSLLNDNSHFSAVSAILSRELFSAEKHRRIWGAIEDLVGSGTTADRLTVSDRLNERGELQAVDGFSYICSLDEGLPPAFNLESYARIIRDKASLRAGVYLGQQLIDRCQAQASDPGTIYSDFENKLAAEAHALSSTEKKIVSPSEAIRGFPGGVNAFLTPHLHMGSLSTGYPKLDEYLYGWQPGKIYVLAAETSVGKSSYALNLIYNLAMEGHPSGMFSLEMTKEELLQKLVCLHARVNFRRFMLGTLSQDERDALRAATGVIAGLPIFIDDSEDLTMRDLQTGCIRMQRDHGVKLIVVDYLQIMDLYDSGYGRTFLNENDALTFITNGVRKLAKKLQVPIVELSQFNKDHTRRDKGDKRPKLTDLHGSGGLRKNAHVVMFIHREEMNFPNRPELRGLAELIIRKNRMGSVGTVNFRFEHGWTRFVEAPEPEPDGYVPDDPEPEAPVASPKTGSLWA